MAQPDQKTLGEHELAATILTEGASPEIATLIHRSMKGLDEALARLAILEEKVAALERLTPREAP